VNQHYTKARPTLIDGGRHVDDRGALSFVNRFDFKGVDRFYWVQSGQAGVPRGWVGHRRDQKWFVVLQGEAVVAVVQPDNWEQPSRDLAVARFTLSAAHPQVLHVPAGYATANVNLAPDTILMIFSSGKIEDAKTDDFRFPPDQWAVLAGNNKTNVES